MPAPNVVPHTGPGWHQTHNNGGMPNTACAEVCCTWRRGKARQFCHAPPHWTVRICTRRFDGHASGARPVRYRLRAQQAGCAASPALLTQAAHRSATAALVGVPRPGGLMMSRMPTADTSGRTAVRGAKPAFCMAYAIYSVKTGTDGREHHHHTMDDNRPRLPLRSIHTVWPVNNRAAARDDRTMMVVRRSCHRQPRRAL